LGLVPKIGEQVPVLELGNSSRNFMSTNRLKAEKD
jgi:hypothetical protein